MGRSSGCVRRRRSRSSCIAVSLAATSPARSANSTRVATARDVLGLVHLARSRVRERFGIELETEVRLVGAFEAEDLQDLRAG